MVNELELKRIWKLISENFSDPTGTITYDKFKNKMQTIEGRKFVWNTFHKAPNLGKYNTIDLGDYNTYEKNLTTDTVSSTTQQPTSVTTPEPSKSIKTVDYQVRYPSTQNPTKPFNSRPCDEKTYDWGYGCKNNKIGQMNQIFFGDRYGDIYGDELINKLRNIGILKSNESKITQEIYNEVLKLGEEQGTPNLQEMIVKETVKNILKERLIKN
jgi:hypothetical protein